MTLLDITGTATRIGTHRRPSMRVVARWSARGLLAALFLFAGGMKLAIPADALAAGTPFAGWFLQLIGALEVLGALGLLASVAGAHAARLVRPAAIGLALIMVGATVSTVLVGDGLAATFPAAVGVLLAWIATSRA